MSSLASRILGLWVLTLLTVSHVAAQYYGYLAECAQSCVASTRTKCPPTNYACACTDSKYMPKLTKCIDTFCDGEAASGARLFLLSLCESVGTPLEIENGERLEVRQNSFGDFSFTDFPTSTGSRLPVATGFPTNPAGGGVDGIGGGRRSRSLKTGAKVGIGVAIPLAIIGVAVLIRYLLVLSKRSKDAAAAGTGEQGQGAQMAGKYTAAAVAGTPGAVPAGYNNYQAVQLPQTSEMAHQAQGPQPWVQGQQAYAQPPQAPQQYPQGQWVFIPAGQPLQAPQPMQGSPQTTVPVAAPTQYSPPPPPSESPGRKQ